MNLEDLTLEKSSDNVEDSLILNENESLHFIMSLINDEDISDDEFELIYQNIRDDVQYYLKNNGEVDLKQIAYFHGLVVYDLYNKYF